MHSLLKIFIVFVVIALAIFIFGRDGSGDKKIIFTDKAPAPIGPYSQAIRSGKMIFVSGQIGLNTQGALDSSSIENETRQALENIKQILDAGGSEMADINKTSIFLTDLKNFKRVNEVYQTFFTSDPPARETVEVKALPKGAHVEISVIAN